MRDCADKWSERFDSEHKPLDSQIKEFTATSLWDDLTDYLQQNCSIKPKLSYSNCLMQEGAWKGWNVKYKKSGKSLCTLYPKQGYFVALIPIGTREIDEAEALMPLCTEYTQNLFKQTASGHSGKSLAVEVKSEDILRDAQNLIALRLLQKA